MARRAIGNLPEDKPAVLLVDETSLKDTLKAMAMAVAFNGRALPVAWRRCPNEKLPMGLAELITETLGWVRESMDEMDGDRKATMVTDGEIGSSPQLIREIEGLGMFCLMRVTKKVRAMMEGGEVSPFDELSDEPGKSWRESMTFACGYS